MQSVKFTIDGVPLLYNGMEVGDTAESGYPALFEKFPIFWDNQVRRPEFPQFYKKFIALRKANTALRRGDLIWLRNSDERRVVTFARRYAGDEFVVAINFSNTPFVGLIEGGGEGFEDVTPYVPLPQLPGQGSVETKKKSVVALPSVALDSWGYRIFKRVK